MAADRSEDTPKNINEALTDDVLLHVLQCVAQDAASPTQAKHFIWMRRTLPRVCAKWSELLRTPSCPVWRTLHVNVAREQRSSGRGAKRSVSSAVSAGSSPPVPSFMNDSSLLSLGTQSNTSLSHSTLGIQVLRSESVLQWMVPRIGACHTLFLDFSNVNHDFDDRRFGVLLSLAKSARCVHILSSPGPGPSDCYEVFLNLQKLQYLHVEGFPSEFLSAAAPYLEALPHLRSLFFKSDTPSCPTAIGPLPTSLVFLELEGLWITSWPHNLPRALRTTPSRSPEDGARSTASLPHRGNGSPMASLESISLHSCYFSPSLFRELMSVKHTPSVSLTWCTLGRLTSDELEHLLPDAFLGEQPGFRNRGGACTPLGVVRMNEVQPSLTSLAFVGCGLCKLRPETMLSLQHLHHLNLSQSQLGGADAFPDTFQLLCNLESLDLSECGLTSLHPNVAALPSIKHINLEDNALTGLPSQFAFAHCLRSASLAFNRLPSLPLCLIEEAKDLEALTLSSGVIAGTPLHLLENLHMLLPNLRRLAVKGTKFESRAVHNLLRMSKRINLARSGLDIAVACDSP